jgi:hypothetical protein
VQNRVQRLGLTVFALLLFAPWITRATVSELNFPTCRQLYLPVLLGGPLVAAAIWNESRGRAPAALAAALLLASPACWSVLTSFLDAGRNEQRRFATALRAFVVDGVASPRRRHPGRRAHRQAVVSLPARSESGVRALRFRFDRPLSDYTFVRFQGCRPRQRIDLAAQPDTR